jgi:hypothetical protein
MKNNPVFLEAINIIGNKKFGGSLITLYISFLTVLLMVSPGGKGNIMNSGFIPPGIYNFIIISVLILSLLILVLSYSILFFKSEDINSWITHGKLKITRVLFEKFLLIVFVSLVIELISFPWIIYSARISAVPDNIVYCSLFVIFIVLITSGYVWIIAGLLFGNKKVFQTVFIWIYLFIFLVISAKAFPDFNPVILLSDFSQFSQDNLSFDSFIMLIQNLLFINLFLFLLIAASSFFLSKKRI